MGGVTGDGPWVALQGAKTVNAGRTQNMHGKQRRSSDRLEMGLKGERRDNEDAFCCSGNYANEGGIHQSDIQKPSGGTEYHSEVTTAVASSSVLPDTFPCVICSFPVL